MRCSAGTDNVGNSFVVARLLTTSFPLNAFLMELALRLQREGAELHLYWLPRLQNAEADALTNGSFAAFSPDQRLRFDLASFKGLVLQDMLDQGLELYEEVRQCRAAKRMRPTVKTSKRDSLRVRDPWQ